MTLPAGYYREPITDDDRPRQLILTPSGALAGIVDDRGQDQLILHQSPDGTALVSGDGTIGSFLKGRTVAIGGDSMTSLNDIRGRPFSPVNVTGVVLDFAEINTATGNGTLAWDASARTLTWTSPGDTAGAPVVVSDGLYTLQSGSAGLSISARVTSRLLPSTNQTDVMAAGTAVWQKPTGSWSGILDALTFGRFTFLPFGIGGNTVADLTARFDQILDADPDVYIDFIGTNSVASAVSSGADIAAQRAANWDRAIARGIQVIVLLMTPRYAASSTDNTNNYSAAKQNALTGANLATIRAARARRGVTVVDPFTPCVVQSTGLAKATYFKDGLHADGGAAYEIAKALATVLNAINPEVIRPMTGAGMYYEATYRPDGNLMTSDQGGFAGTGGTAGTGVTAGAGLAAGWQAARTSGAAVLATANKIATTDEGPDWQEFDISTAAVDSETIRFFASAVAAGNWAVGDTLEFGLEFYVIGTGCMGVYGSLFNTGGPLSDSRAHQIRNIPQGLRDGERGLVRLSQVMPTGATSVNATFYIDSKAGAAFKVRVRSAYVRRVI